MFREKNKRMLVQILVKVCYFHWVTEKTQANDKDR